MITEVFIFNMSFIETTQITSIYEGGLIIPRPYIDIAPAYNSFIEIL